MRCPKNLRTDCHKISIIKLPMSSGDKSAEQTSSSPPISLPPPPPPPPPSSTQIFRDRILLPTILAGALGSGVGLFSKHRNALGLANICATYATNSAIVAGFYCGAREFVRISRTGKNDDLLNSAIGGFGTGAILGRLQGGPPAAIRYSVIFTVVGTSVDYATLKLKPILRDFYESMAEKDIKLPEWSPIRVLDEEEQAAKRAREQQIYDKIHNLNKGKS